MNWHNPKAHVVTLPRLLLTLACWCGLTAITRAAELEYRTVSGFGGVPLAVVETGNRDGPAIVFVHGSSQATRAWKKQFSDPALSASFHLIAFDLRGHGASGKPWQADAYSADALAGDVQAVIEATTADKVVLVPWSFGGNVAFAYVRKFGLERVAGINITASRSAFGPSTRRAEMTDAERTALNNRSAAMRSDDLAVNAAATRDFIRDLSATPLSESDFSEFFTFNMMTPAYVRRAKSSFRPDNSDLGARLTVPVLVSYGAADAFVSLKDGQRIHRMVDGSQLSVYEGVGHMPFHERPERYNRELAEFVRKAQTAPKASNAAAAVGQDAGDIIVDCADCPEMVVVPPGMFVMGRQLHAPMRGGKTRYLGPTRTINIAKGFALGRTEVTNKQFAAFVEERPGVDAASCYAWGGENRTWGFSWDDPGLGRPIRDDEPVVCVSWRDANAYANWLSEKTGKPYRLATEAEWEYAARGANGSSESSAASPSQLCAHGNVLDRSAAGNADLIAGSSTQPEMAAPCDDGYPLVAPVAQYKPNAFGLHDMIGNVWEWVQDCSVIPYPADTTQSAAVEVAGGCERRSIRGGSWRTRASRQTVTFRGRDPEDTTYHLFGFRVARDLQ